MHARGIGGIENGTFQAGAKHVLATRRYTKCIVQRCQQWRMMCARKVWLRRRLTPSAMAETSGVMRVYHRMAANQSIFQFGIAQSRRSWRGRVERGAAR